MYTFQLPNLPPNTLADGLKFVRDCKVGDLIESVGYIRFGETELVKKELKVKSYVFVPYEYPLKGWLFRHGTKYFIQADINYSVDESTVVQVIQGAA